MTTDSAAASKAAGAPPPRWVLKAVTRSHVFLHRLTGGRLFNRLARWSPEEPRLVPQPGEIPRDRGEPPGTPSRPQGSSRQP
jgi:hypothetical protein